MRGSRKAALSPPLSAAPRDAGHRPAPRPAPFAARLRVLIILSGAVALVYQSLWMRQLSLILGSTTYAVGTVLAAFMAGLGVGAWALGRAADRTAAPLRLYAGLELAIGLAGLSSPWVLSQGGAIYAFCYERLVDSRGLLTFARFLIGFAFVAVPAFLMGGTLPVAARYVIRRSEEVGRGVGLLYALNTLGAAAGTLLLPFVLLPTLGMRAALLLSGLTNIAIAVAAWGGARREPAAAAPEPARPATAGHPPARPVPGPAPVAAPAGLLPAFFLSGFVALGLEVVWNRFFVMYVGSSIYSYAVILFLYLAGIVIGGLVFTALDRRGASPDRIFRTCLLLLVLDLMLTVPLMDRIIFLQVATLDLFGINFYAFQLASAAAVCLVVVPPTVLLGVSFPAVAKAMSADVGKVGSRLGLAYLVNTAGTTAGALAASFALIPGLGLRHSLELLTVLAGVSFGVASWTRGASPLRQVGAAAPAGLALLLLGLPAWDTRLMHTSIAKDPSTLEGERSANGLPANVLGMRMLEVRDGVDATVGVAAVEDVHVLYVNGKPDASDGWDMGTQVALGHLPLLVHPAARDVLVIGMGSGVTVGAAAAHPAAVIDLVEISPEVLELGARYFRKVNHDVIDDPRVKVHLEDGRNFVAFNEARAYDVIISEPSNPWMTGVSNLFTDEFFAQTRRRLRPGGILAQWFHYYSMSPDDLRVVLGTVHHNFAHLYAFAFHHSLDLAGDMVILASDSRLDFARALAAFRGEDARASEPLKAVGFEDPRALFQSLIFTRENVQGFVAGAPLNSDDRPWIELAAPRSLFTDTVIDNLRVMLEASDDAVLPASEEEKPTDAFQVRPPEGFRRTETGFRVDLLGVETDELPPRRILRQAKFDDDAGRHLTLVSGRGLRDRPGLDHLAAHVGGGAPLADGAPRVAGHEVVAYQPSAPVGAVLAWTCGGTSYAASLTGAGRDADATAILTGVRCHPDH